MNLRLACRLLVLLISGVVTPTLVGASAVTIPNILIVDDSTDPLGIEEGRGGVVVSRYEFETFLLASVAAGFVDPVATQMLPDRTLYVVDESADPLGTGDPVGAVFHVDPTEGPTTSVATPVMVSSLFRDPADIVTDPEGRILIVDRNADPFRTNAQPGAVFRSDGVSGNVEVLGSHPEFVEPRSLAWDIDGHLLILDSNSDPNGTRVAPGALFRLDVDTGEVVMIKAFDPQVITRSRAVAVLPDGDYAIVDKDADPNDRGGRPGAVFRLERDTGKMSVLLSDPNFVDPIDVLIGRTNELWVLDESADPDGFPNSVGAILRYDLGLGIRTFLRATGLTESPRGISFASGPDLSNSTVEYIDESGGLLKAGDLVTVRVSLQNDGTSPGEGAVFTDDLAGRWEYVDGSVTASLGAASFDQDAGSLSWAGDILEEENAEIEYRLRVPTSFADGEPFDHILRFSVDGVPSEIENEFTFFAGFELGTMVFVDQRTISGDEFGLIFQIEPGETEMNLAFSGAPLVAPTDAVFLPDGRLAILDRRAIEVEGVSGRQAIFLYDHADGSFTTLFQRAPDDGLVDPSGIVYTNDGTLLLVDRDSNPLDLEYPQEIGDFGPGAVYEIDLETGARELVFSDVRMREPVDVDVDSNGVIVVVDYKGTEGRGDFWEYDPTTELVSRRILNDVWFRDPIGLTLDSNDDAYVADVTHFTDGGSDTIDNGTVFLVRRDSPTTYAIRSQSGLLVDPGDCYIDRDGILYITDRDANPRLLETSDTGAVFSIDTTDSDANLRIVAASFSLVAPDGPAVFEPTPLALGSFVVNDRNGGVAVPGDTLDVRLQIANPGFAPIEGIYAQFLFDSRLDLLDLSAPSGSVGIDAASSRGSWTGTLLGQEVVIVNSVLQISPETLFGDILDVSAVVEGQETRFERELNLSVAGPFAENEILFCDGFTDPDGVGGSPGAIFRLKAVGESPEIVRTGPPMTDMTALAWTDSGDLLVADRNGLDPGFIFRIETATGEIVTVIENDERITYPSDLVRAPNGDLLVVDRQYEAPGKSGLGAIFRLPGGEGPAEIFASSDEWVSPTSAAYTPGGRLFVVDRRANPDGRTGNTGTIFELDPADGSPIATFQDSLFVEPTGIIAVGDTMLIVTDVFANPREFPDQTGALFALDLRTSEVVPYWTSTRFVSPFRTYARADGTFFILDQAAAGPNQEGLPGLLFHFDPQTRALVDYAISDDFFFPVDLLVRPSSFLEFTEYVVEDADGTAPLFPTDKLRFEVKVENIGPAQTDGARFVDQPPPGVQILAESLTASAGSIRLEGDRVVWDGPVASNGEVTLTYEGQLDPFTTEGVSLTFAPVLTGPAVGDLNRSANLNVFVSFESGFLYAVDADADPLDTGAELGGILKINQYTGETARYFGSTEWRHPVDIALVGDTNPVGYIIDSQLRETGLPGRGALFRLDTATQELTKIARGDDFSLLSSILVEDEQNLLVLDAWADPEDLTPGQLGPGALYRVPLSTGVPELIYTDATLREPRDMTWLADGTLAILDSAADPAETGAQPGGLFGLDMDDFSIELLATSEEWVEPVSLTRQANGTLWIVDQEATLDSTSSGHGSVWQYTEAGGVQFYAASEQFRSLQDIWIPGDRVPLVVDADADPTTEEGGRGAVFRADGAAEARFSLFSSTTDMAEPQAVIVYQDVTPVISMPVVATTLSAGIEVAWTGLSAQPNTRYLLYRKSVEGPDTEPPLEEGMDDYNPVPLPRSYVGPGPHQVIDRSYDGGQWYAYRVVVVYPNGETDVSQPIYGRAPVTRLELSLSGARPNPFAASTSLRFTIPATARIELAIFDVAGRRIRQLVDGMAEAGEHEVIWDGRSDAGARVASGVYFAKLDTEEQDRTRRIVLTR